MQNKKLVLRHWIWFIAPIFLLLPGCSSLGYYVDVVNGHAQVINSAEPIEEVLVDGHVDAEVKQALQKILAAREFAINQLLLDADGSYTQYADLKRKYVVWNVVATDEFSVEANKWCYWFVGCLAYRGFYSQQKANEFANNLREQGSDVLVGGVRAYSTLGWFDDPVLNTMLYRDEAMQLNLIFHELAHGKMYFKSDTAFNEAFATAVADEGVRRWYTAKGEIEKYQRYVDKQKYQHAFNSLLKNTQASLKRLYEQDLTAEEKRKQKQLIFKKLKLDYRALTRSWHNDKRYDKWMEQDLNNAHLALISTYYELVPGFKALLKQQNNDLLSFYQAVLAMQDLSSEERYARIMSLAQE